MNIDVMDILSRIPDYETFMTLEEMDESTFRLAEKYAGIVSVKEIGKSREGRSIYCLKIGQGSENALLVGCPHPNEPIGAMMLETFSEILAKDEELRKELNYTFYIIKAVDPDGLKKNEGWLKGPFTYYNYARHFFRPAGSQQVEWTFPIHYKGLHFEKPIPETKALMKLIDTVKPRFIYSLHNSGFSGAYWYVFSPDGMDYLVENLPKVPEKYGVFLKKGEPETPYCKEYGDAVYKLVNVEDMYDFYEANLPKKELSRLMTWGTTSVAYANQNGNVCDGLIAEIGYFKSEYLHDTSESGYTRREAVLEKCNTMENFAKFLHSYWRVLQKYLPEDDQYRLALEGLGDGLLADVKSERALIEANDEEYSKIATKAQWFDNVVALPYMFDLWYGVIASASERATMLADESGKAELEQIKDVAEKKLKKETDRLEEIVPCEVFKIRDMVAFQMESGLIGMQAARKKKQNQ